LVSGIPGKTNQEASDTAKYFRGNILMELSRVMRWTAVHRTDIGMSDGIESAKQTGDS